MDLFIALGFAVAAFGMFALALAVALVTGWPKTFRITANGREDVYMTRRFLFGGPRNGAWALMLHHMHRPDADRCHPWRFWTLVLWGGYWEEVTYRVRLEFPLGRGEAVPVVRRQWNRPGMLLFRPATHTHRVSELPRGHAWTLVLRGPKERTWGFWNKAGQWRPYKEFVNWVGAALWCKEE